MVVGPIAIAYKLNGVNKLVLDGHHDRQDLPRQDHDVERPGDHGAELRRDPAVDEDLGHTTARTRRAPRRTSRSYLAATAPTVFTATPDKDSSKAHFAGQGKAKSQGVSAAIASTEGSIGYDEFSFAVSSGLQTASHRQRQRLR